VTPASLWVLFDSPIVIGGPPGASSLTLNEADGREIGDTLAAKPTEVKGDLGHEAALGYHPRDAIRPRASSCY
jgi:hypothetical protein